MKTIVSYLKSLQSLFYPEACVGCGSSLLRNEDLICLGCELNLPVNAFIQHAKTPALQVFDGRLPLVYAHSFLDFSKNGIAQHLIHALKYQDREDVGEFLGRRFAEKLDHLQVATPDVIVPVPLHKTKYKTRGYNQCSSIARGMQQVWNCDVADNAVNRAVANPSQTKLSRARRWDNVKGIFTLKKPELLTGKHVLLIDDTLTTGATLESCGITILEANDVRLSIATLAIAR